MGASLGPADRAEYERDLEAARAQLDEATFTRAWKAGQAMSVEQAIAYALEGTHDAPRPPKPATV